MRGEGFPADIDENLYSTSGFSKCNQYHTVSPTQRSIILPAFLIESLLVIVLLKNNTKYNNLTYSLFAKESREQAAETCLVLTPLLLRDSPVSSCLQYSGMRRLEEPLLPSFPLL
ncbi:hypothetical protein BO86DRAFT_376008 [Aspergillus japonicus CBS 114.51]|uniref:Uncharacterized protein n=1 Tax=Aspergillus japonicus CBS 114.51 TaxID=1448312 RepID=A0A8T8XC53_ASPJA|nr:hypothetical protein BO86DRAFT_376008 [Aspergillus japonicus CBS 114.51]RAH85675.1 hypothetical protein BO86DRAFT_376008 [Aspergillus japonicus CBS 114.51]